MGDNEKEQTTRVLQDYRDQQGGVFGLVFDEKQALQILKEFLPLIVRDPPGECSCADPRCPHKGPVSALGIWLIAGKLKNCLQPTKSLFEAIQCDDYEIVDSKYDQTKEMQVIDPIDISRVYHRQRVRFGIKGRELPKLQHGGKSQWDEPPRPKIPRGILEILEGVEFTNPDVKFVHFVFSGQRIIVPINAKDKDEKQPRVFVKCPFLIALRALQFVQFHVEFYDATKKDIGYDFDSWIIGGQVNGFEVALMPDICVEFIDPMTNERACARYRQGMMGFSINGCVHANCRTIIV